MIQRGQNAKFSGNLSGFRISKKNTNSYLADAAVYASGPIANFAAAILFPAFIRAEADYVILSSVINLATGLSNLLPIKGYDGYGIIYSLLCLSEKWEKFQAIMDVVSLASVTFVLLISLYVMARIGDGYWTAGLFVISLTKAVSESLKKYFS